MLEKLEIVSQMFHGFDLEEYFAAATSRKLALILAAEDHVLGLENGRKCCLDEVTALSQAFAIAVPHEKAMAVKVRLAKFSCHGSGASDEEMEASVRQVVDNALAISQVVDVFDAAGIRKPDISVLSEEFLLELRDMEHKNVALEVLKKLLRDEIKARAKKNLVRSSSLMELLEHSINGKVVTAAEGRRQAHLALKRKGIRPQIPRKKNASKGRGPQYVTKIFQLGFRLNWSGKFHLKTIFCE